MYLLHENIYELLETIDEAISYIDSDFSDSPALWSESNKLFLSNIEYVVTNVNTYIFEYSEINYNSLNRNLTDLSTIHTKAEFLSTLSDWKNLIIQTINRRETLPNSIDVDFDRVMDIARYVDYNVLVKHTIQALHNLEDEQIKHITKYYNDYRHFWGGLDPDNNNYEVIENRIHELIHQREQYIWLFHRLGDYRSKLVLLYYLRYWLSYDPYKYVLSMKENVFKDYFDLDLFQCDKNEVIVDLGAYNGDTFIDYTTTYPSYKRYYCFEASKKNFQILSDLLSKYNNTVCINKGAGDKTGVMYLKGVSAVTGDSGTCSAFTITDEITDEIVELVTVDEAVTEPVTFIKMDIEGSEQSAVKGCKQHIIDDKPKLAICVYHNNEDMWKIPKMIEEIRDDYSFYLRSNGSQWGPAELVFFAL